MTTIRGNVPVSTTTRVEDSGTRIPFAVIDDGSGRATRGNIEEALGQVYPALTQAQAEQLARAAFESLPGSASSIDAAQWAKLEPQLIWAGGELEQQNAVRGVGGASGWLNATGLAPNVPIVGNAQIPLAPAIIPGGGYMPRNDFALTGYNPYQYPMGMPAPMLNGRMPGMPYYETPGHQAITGAGRGLWGFMKMMPGVGNVLNGIDFVRDIGKGLATWVNPMRTMGEKMKATSDLLFHGAGMIIPQVGGAYDMAQGALRVGAGMMRMGMNPMAMNPMMAMANPMMAMANPMMAMAGMNPMAMANLNPFGTLPPFNYMNAGIPNVYNMQFQNPVFSSPYMFNQFPNYSMYPPHMMNQAFMPNWLGPMSMFRQPFPMMPYGMNAPMGTPQDAAKGAVRTGVGALKMMPGVGNLLNGVDFVMDLGHLFTGRQSFMKTAADLLFHGAGMLVPQVGGAYDMAQGTIRMAAGRVMNPMMMSPFAMPHLPPFAFANGGFPPMYNSPFLF